MRASKDDCPSVADSSFEARCARTSRANAERSSGDDGFGMFPLHRHTSTFPRQVFARVLQIHPPPKIQRAQGMSDARCTRGLACNVHRRVRTRAYRAAEAIRHSLRNGFTAYFVLSPVNGSFATVAPWEAIASRCMDASTATSGPHAFAVRVSHARCHGLRVHRIPPHVRSDRERPSGRAGRTISATDSTSDKAKYF